MATLYQPSRGLLAWALTWWRRRRCTHMNWTPLDGCPACGKDFR